MRKSFFSSSYFDDLREESTHKLMVNDVEDERQQKNLEGDIKNPSRYSTKEVLMKQKRRIQKKQAKRADLADLFMGFAGLTKHVYVVRNKKNERTLWLHNENSINHWPITCSYTNTPHHPGLMPIIQPVHQHVTLKIYFCLLLVFHFFNFFFVHIVNKNTFQFKFHDSFYSLHFCQPFLLPSRTLPGQKQLNRTETRRNRIK